MEHFIVNQGLYVIDSRNQEAPIISVGVNGTLFVNIQDGKTIWRRSVSEDEITMLACRQLGRNMVHAINSLAK